MVERRELKKIPFDIKTLIIGGIFSLLIIVFQIYEQQKIIDIKTRDAGRVLTNKIRAKIEEIENITDFLKEVSLANNGKVSRVAFDKVASFLYSIYSDNEVTGIFYLNGGKIEYAYPVEGNRGTLGIDILKRDDRKEAALLAIEKRQTVLSGPYDLYQGKKGLIIRNPIFLIENGEEKFIGFSVVTIKFPGFINNLTLNELNNYNYKITTLSDGEEKKIASKGKVSTFAKTFTIEILNSEWKITIESTEKISEMRVIIIVGISLFILTLLLSNISYHYQKNKLLLEERELDKRLLILILEKSKNIVIFIYNDENKKISFINKRSFLEEYSEKAEISSKVLEDNLIIEEGKEELLEIFTQIKGGKKRASCIIKKRSKQYGEILEKITLTNPFVDKYGMKKIIGIVEDITLSDEKEK